MEIPVKVVIHRDADGKLWAEVPGLPGCATEGDTIDELRANLREAVEGCFGTAQDIALQEGECKAAEVLSLLSPSPERSSVKCWSETAGFGIGPPSRTISTGSPAAA